jgi:hypothetical protein
MTPKELADHKKEFPKSQKKNIECWPGTAALTYIEECNMERRLARSLEDETFARPLTWGNLSERMVFELLPTAYKLCSQDTISHPTIVCWKGSPDAEKFDTGKTVVDIKSPFTLKSFCHLVQPLYDGLTGMKAINAIRDNHKEGETYYWQLVSNAILTGSKHAELIVFCPYKSELEAIRELARSFDESIASKYIWINYASDDELPWIPDGGYYKNLNIIRFEVPEADKKLLAERVKMAMPKLIEFKPIVAHASTPVAAD